MRDCASAATRARTRRGDNVMWVAVTHQSPVRQSEREHLRRESLRLRSQAVGIGSACAIENGRSSLCEKQRGSLFRSNV